MKPPSHSTPVILLVLVQSIVLTVFLADGGTYHLSRTLAALTDEKRDTSTGTATPAKRIQEADTVAAPREADAHTYDIGSPEAEYAAIDQAGSSAAFMWTGDEPRGRTGSATATTVALRTADSLPPPPTKKPADTNSDPMGDPSMTTASLRHAPAAVTTASDLLASLSAESDFSLLGTRDIARVRNDVHIGDTLSGVVPAVRSSDSSRPGNIEAGQSGTAHAAPEATGTISGSRLFSMDPTRSSTLLIIATSSSSAISSAGTGITGPSSPPSSGVSSASSDVSSASFASPIFEPAEPGSFSLQLTDLLQSDPESEEADSMSSIAPLLP